MRRKRRATQLFLTTLNQFGNTKMVLELTLHVIIQQFYNMPKIPTAAARVG